MTGSIKSCIKCLDFDSMSNHSKSKEGYSLASPLKSPATRPFFFLSSSRAYFCAAPARVIFELSETLLSSLSLELATFALAGGFLRGEWLPESAPLLPPFLIVGDFLIVLLVWFRSGTPSLSSGLGLWLSMLSLLTPEACRLRPFESRGDCFPPVEFLLLSDVFEGDCGRSPGLESPDTFAYDILWFYLVCMWLLRSCNVEFFAIVFFFLPLCIWNMRLFVCSLF